MNDEMKGLKESDTFKELKSLPEGEKDIWSKWVLPYKSGKDGNFTKTKARLVATGFMQREGVNYNQTAAPTPTAASVKTVFAVANQMGFTIYHVDVKQAYTKARLDNKIVMKLPGGCGELSGKYVDSRWLCTALSRAVCSGTTCWVRIWSPCMEWNSA